MLSKIATAGQNGQFRTPRHIIQLMVEMMAPGPKDEICDPACGTAGFLVASAEYVNRTHHEALLEPAQRKHFNESMFHGFDFDSTMLRIGSMNMLLHEVENPDIRYRDSLAQSAASETERYSLILANPPFAGSLDYEVTAKDLQAVAKTKKTELLFLALFLRLLKPGGQAAVIVPDGVLSGSSQAHKGLRRLVVEDHKLDAVVKLPGGVFKPYSGVSTAILFFTKTNSGGTDNVWFYEVTADGWSLDDKRTALLPEDKLGPIRSKRWTRPITPRTTCPTCWPAGSDATAPNRSEPGPSKASASRKLISSPKATTSVSTATRRSSTTRSSTDLPQRS
jgi:type I restriction enzyme M protein